LFLKNVLAKDFNILLFMILTTDGICLTGIDNFNVRHPFIH
jgi:hypothetical protein